MRRRQLLAAAGTVVIGGCADLSSIDESTPASSFPPATPVWHVTPPYPFRFDGELTVSPDNPRGWLLADVQPKRVRVAGEVLEGGPINAAFSEEEIDRARVPASTFETLSAASTFEKTVAYPAGGGSFFFHADRETTLDLRVEIERT
ncbi:membrane lipoprotein [Halorhabdus tiamatea SARL4B]|uniref:Membrane lipoprotein n=1 Tax=Halorhabdus tiamatea SARL4B TaxID=1033806 RepID=S6CSH0_9EURY|nr:hypothetical protein [Halorhabdus tiamatea]ERJ07100.1 membrane lipoprotein [Halorhabdus tiamatea SARL4B]CCQ32719.1 hypothetical protein HTIA_0575 [Halorhabdus tiamatea SARL4B]